MSIKIDLLKENLNVIRNIITLLNIVDVEPLKVIIDIREILQRVVLENYEIMLETNPIETKKNIKNFLVNRIRDIMDNTKENLNIDINLIKDYTKNLKLDVVDSDKLDYVMDKFSDKEAFELIGHKITINDNMEDIRKSLSVLSTLPTSSAFQDDFGIMLEKYNALIALVDKFDTNDCFLNKDLVTEIKFGLVCNDCQLGDLVNLKPILLDKITVIETKIEDVKNNIPNIKFNKVTLEKLDKTLMDNIDYFLKGTINLETFEHNIDGVLNTLDYYSFCMDNYIKSIINYISFIELYVVSNNKIEELINTTYNIFNKN